MMRADVAVVLECFRRYDSGQKGYLTKDEVKWAVTALLGSTPTKLVLVQLFNIPQEQYKDMRIDQDIFLQVMIRRMENVNVTETIRRWFKAFDTDSSGFISWKNFEKICQVAAPHMPRHVVFQLFREADVNHDDKVSYGEFERMMLLSIYNEQTLHS
ncbi:EF-hand calcium-binding domain-containing protein 11 [Aphanomyces cochlioides]|nr:EF-hand calcium-binding domain-containing protein 11 [Aphanomyces cochlioides]